MPNSFRDLELRLQSVEENQGKVQELIDLLNDVQSALRIFVKIGNGVKWLAVLASCITAAAVGIRKWL